MNKQVRPPQIDAAQSKKTVDELLRGFNSGISYRALEPRIAFDGAAVATAAATADAQHQSTDSAAADKSTAQGDAHDTPHAPEKSAAAAESHDANAPQTSDTHANDANAHEALADAIVTADAPAAHAPVTIVFIDKSVENVGQIVSVIDPSWEIVMIDDNSSGLSQMASYLQGRTDVGSIHVVSHGEAGTLYLGNDSLTNANLAEHQDQLAVIGKALNDNGDILLYGCDIGAGTGGMDFVRAFSDMTGADIAASVNRTGGDESGGDWVLEATSGSIEAKSLENPLYAGILAKTNSGTWAANGATAANDWQNTTDGITTTVTFTNGGSTSWSGVANGTLNTAAGGLSATTFDNGAVGSASLETTWGATNTSDTGTITITFSTAVTNPVIHIDRLGGVVSGVANSAILTLTSGGTITRVSGVNHFVVDSTAGTITRQVGGSTASNAESNTNTAQGTAAGSIRVNGTYTTITFSVKMSTGAGAGSGDSFELAFAIDAPPTAVNDTFTVAHDTPATINVRANDTDPRGDTLTVTKVNGTAITAGGAGVAVTGGTVTLVSGNLVFTPTANYVGTPSFTYTVADANGGESTATVTGTVTNAAPTLDLDGSTTGTGFSTTFKENGPAVSIANTDAAIVDADDTNLESATVSLTNQQTGDRLLVNGSSASSGTIGTIAWTRTDTAVTFTGTATKAQYAAAIRQIQFENTTDTPSTTARVINTTVHDGNDNSNTAVTTVAIDRAPDPTDDAFSGNEDTAISNNVLTNDTDVGDGPGSPPLSIVTGPANGTLTSFNTTTGAFVYTPNLNYNGTDTFVYRYTDSNGDSKTATVTLTIIPVNDAPVNTVPATLGPVAEDGTLNITGVSVADVDSNALTTTVSIGNGTLSLGATGGATVSGNGTGLITLAGTPAQINAALATLSYTPTADYNGSATFQISTTDGALAASTSRTITITPVADIANDAVTTPEDTPVTFSPLANDSFENSGRTITAINGTSITAGGPGVSVTGGTVTLSVSGNLTYTPNLNYNGTPSFTYTVTSGGVTETATVNMTVTPVNDAPVAVNDTGTIAEDTTLTVNAAGGLLSNDSDVDGNTLAVTQFSVAGVSGTFTAGTTATIPSVGTLRINADGSYVFTPAANYNGSVPVATYTVSDGAGGTGTATLSIAVTPVNDAPTAVNDTRTFAEDATLTVNAASGLLSNDSDVDGDTLTITQFSVAGVSGTFAAGATATIPAVGTLRINADGSYVFTPAANYNGSVPAATYTVSDGQGGTATATLSIAVTPVNDAPVAVNDTGVVNEDTTLTVNAAGGLLSNDSDVDGNTLAVTQFTVAGVSGSFAAGSTASIAGVGTLRINADGSYVFTPAANYNGSVPVATYTVSDGAGGTATATLSIAVTPVNDAPTAVNDTGVVNEDTTLTVNAAGGLLSNDSDVDGNTLTITQFSVAGVSGTFTAGTTATIPAVGTLRINADGSYVFTPAANYNGSVPAATYTVSDGQGGTATATLSIAVTPVNDAPVAVNDTGVVNEDTTLTVNAAGGLLSNDSDVDGNTLAVTQFTVAGVSGSFAAGSTASIAGVGTLRINADGSYVFTPAANYNGSVPVATYTVSDGAGGTATATLSIAVTPVNDAPTAVNDTGVVNEDTTLTVNAAGGLLSNDSDVDGNTLTITQFSVAGVSGTFTAGTTATIPAVGTLRINADGSYVFTPAANYNGSVPAATYTVSDGQGGTATATLSIAVTPVNDAPVHTVPGAQTTAEDTNLVITGVTVTDVDGGSITTTLSIPSASGTLSVLAGSGATITGGGTNTITLTGTPAQINAAMASITYVPRADYNGAISLSVVSNDGVVTTSNSVAITVTPVADITNDNISGTEDTSSTFNVITGTGGATADNFEGSPSVTSITQPANGTVTFAANGAMTYTPNANYNGTDTFTYTVTSGGVTETATVTITVAAVNDAPVNSVPGAQTTAEDANIIFSSANGNAITVTDVDSSVTTTLTIANGTLTLGSISGVTVTGNGTGTVTVSGSPASITAALNGLRFSPTADYNGSATLSVSTSDGVAPAVANTVAITVTPVADIVPNSVTTAEDTAATFNVLANDNFENPGATVSSVTQPANGSVTIGSGGNVTYTPNANYNGTDTFTYTVTSGGVTETTTVTMTVTPVNDAPVAVNDTGTVAEDTTLTVNAASGLLSNDSDVDGNTLSITQFSVTGVSGTFTAGTSASIPGVGTLTINANGSYTFVPAANYNGSVPAATYTVSDGQGGTATATLSIAVTPVNDAPVAVNDTGVVNEDTTLTVNAAGGLLSNDSDVDGNTLTITQFSVSGVSGTFAAGSTATIPAVGTLRINADGSYVFTPAANYNGSVPTTTYTVSDGQGGNATATLSIAVTPVNDAPIAVDDTGTLAEDTTRTVSAAAGLLSNDTDVDGNPLTITQFTVAGVSGTFTAGTTATIPSVGTLRINADGSYVFTPAANYNGTVPVATYTVSDGAGGTDTGTLSLVVTPVNDAPVAGNDTGVVNEDTTLTVNAAGGLLANDSDVDGNPLTITQFAVAGVSGTFTAGTTATIPSVGTLRINADGSYVFTPAANYNGAVPAATYTVSDGQGGTATATLSIAVTPVNDAPIAVDDTGTLAEDTTRTVTAAAGLLSNDTDVDGNTLTITQFTVAGVSGSFTAGSTATIAGVGTLRINADGSYVFTPAANYNGTVPVATYTVSDGQGGTDTGTLTLTVTPVNDAPVATNDTGTTAEDTTLTVNAAGGLLSNDSDVDGNALAVTQFTVSGVSGTFTAGSTATIAGVGTLRINADGSYVFAPAANYNGSVPTATYTVSDGQGGTATATLTIAVTPVNDAPVAVDDTGTTAEDTTLTVNAASGLLSNDTDVEGNTLTITQFSVAGISGSFTAGTTATIAGVGTLTINANGSYTFVPAANYNGSVPVATYTVSDGQGGTDTGTLTIGVTPVNDAPVNTVPGPRTIAEDTPTAIAGVSVSDVDGGTLTTTVTVTNGRLNVTLGGGATITGNGTGTITLTGSAATINAALAGLSFTGNADYNGPATLTVQTSDGSLTDTDTVAISVTPVADIVADNLNGTEDTTLSFNVLTGAGGASADNFEGSPVVSGFTQPSNGSVTVAANGAVVYTPNANFNGVDTFTYTVTSGGVTETTTVTINVAAVNDAPTQTLPPTQSGTEDTNVVFSGANGNQIVVGDVDTGAVVTTTVSVPSGALTAITTPGVTITGNGTGSVVLSGAPAAVTAALNGLTYAPVADANGLVTMSVSTTDGVASPVSGTVAINIAPVADIQNDTATTAEDTAATITVLGNDTFENPGRAVTSVTNGANGTVTINANGTVTYTPNANYNGTDSFTYTVTSGGVTETANVTVTVTPVNDPVTQTAPASQSTAEDSPLVFSGTNGNAVTVADIDGDNLTTTVSVTNGRVNLGSVAGVTVSGNGTGTVTLSGSAAAINAALNGLSYTPTADFNGASAMTVTTSDGATTASNTVAITVSPVVDIAADAVTTNEDTAVVINVLANDTFENAGRTVTSVTQPANGTVTIGSGGQLTYTPNANFNGTSTFTYTVTSGGVTETATVTVTVNPVNDPVVTAVPAAQTTSEDTNLVFSTANGNAITVTDVDGDTISMTVSATNGNLTLGGTSGVTVSGNGTGTITLSGSPAAINTALNGLRFAPTADYNGSAAITVQASDGATSTNNTIPVTVTPVADVVADTVSTTEDTAVTFNALTNDTFENPGRTVTSVTQGTSGAVTFSANGTMTYTPNLHFYGTDTFTYTVTSNGTTETATVTVSVGAVNGPPTTTGLPDRTGVDAGVVSINVSSAFADKDGDPLTYTATGLPAGLTINPTTGVISGTIDRSASQSGPYSVTVTASDGNPGGTVSTAFTWTVSNPAPTAHNDAVTVAEDSAPTNVNVLANDVDPDGDPLTVTTATAGHGTVSIQANGTIRYQPDANFNGTDTISYQISDGQGGFSTATVTLTVTPVNDAPVAGDDTRTTAEDTTLTVPAATGVLANDTDVDGDTLSVTQFTVAGVTGSFTAGNTATIAGVGTLRINADGSYVFTPAANYNGTVPVATYTVSDGKGGTDTGTLALTVTPVNDAPVAGDDTRTTAEDTTLTVPAATGLLANDVDVDGNPLTITQFTVAGVTGTFAPGSTATIAGVGTLRINADGSYVFTPAANYNGAVPVATYTVSDGQGGTDTATLTLTVTPVNDAPVAGDDTRTTAEDTTLTVPAATGVLANDTDVDGDTLSVTQFTVAGVTGSFTAGNTATIAGVGTLRINADGSYVFTPAANYNGTVPVATYTVSDGKGGTDTGTLALTVTPVNDAPVAVADTRTTTEGANLTVTAASGVLSNDTDVDGDSLSVSAINGVPANVGQAVAGSSGGVFTVNADGSYTFAPNGQFEDLGVGETRQTTVTYTVSDGHGGTSTATVTITVTGTNDAPVATAIPPSAGVDGATFSLNTSTSFSDVDGDTLTYTATGLPAGLTINPATGVISGTINRAASQGGTGGVYTVTITANDGNGGSTPATLTLTVTNPAPNAVNDTRAVTEDTAATGNVLANDVDPDGDPLSVTGFAVAGISGTFNPGDTANIPGVGTLTINADGSYVFTPAPDYIGAVPQVTYAISDGNGGTDTATLDLGPVTPGNDAPTSTPLAPQSSVDAAAVTLNVSGNFSDGDGDPLTFSATGLPPGLSINPTTGVISGTIDHLASSAGSYTVKVTATDPSGAKTEQTFAWAVTNPAPTGAPIANATGVDGTAVTMPLAAGFSDPDGDTITYSASGLPAGLSINPASGVITGTLGKNASVGGSSSNGVYTIAVTATDSQGALVTRSFTYTVSNPAPVAGNDAFSGAEDSAIAGNVSTNDSDPDGDALSYGVVTGPAHGTLVFNPNGTFTYTPAANYSGPDTFTYRVTDANGASATAVVSLTVTPVNDAPVAANVSVTTPEDVIFNGTLTATDVDGPSMTFTKATNPAHGTVVVNPDGTYVYTPVANYNGPDSFNYTVSDGAGGTVTRTVTINVTPVNDAPVADNETGTTPEDTTLNVPASSGLLVGDTDVDGDTLTITQFAVAGDATVYTAGTTATIPSVGTLRINANGSYTFTPAANYNGPVPVATYTVSDGNGGTDTATLTLTVTPVNDAPIAANVSVTTPEDVIFNGTLTATDVDGPSMTFTKATNPAHGTVVVNPDGTYVYTPVANYNGPDSFNYTVSDGAGGTVTRTVTINVTPVNDAPIAVDDAFSGNEDTVINGDVTPGTAGQDRDIDGDTITVVDADGNPGNGISPVSGPANGTVVLNANGTFAYTPNANFHGTDSFRYRISDGNGGFAEATVTLTVRPVNDAPTAANGSATTPEDTPYSGTLPPATDVDGDTVTYVKATNPSHGTVVVNADGTYVYTPSANYNGTDTFKYSINDGKGGVATYTVTVIVTPVDDPTVILTVKAPPSKDADVINFDLSQFVKDPDGKTLVYTATGLPPGLTINPSTGVVTGTLPRDASQHGPYNVTLTVNDGHGGTVTTTFPWPVTNPAPQAVDDRATVTRDKDVTVNVLANDRDPDGDPLTVTHAQAANGTVQVLPDGSIHYVPKDGFVGTDRITYAISDGNGGTAIASVIVTVTDDGYHDKPRQFGFNGPGEPDPLDGEPIDTPYVQGIAADGAVIDAVYDIGMLRSVAGQLGANGAVLAAANGVRSLDGVAWVTDNSVVVETVRVERAREILLNAGFDRTFQEYKIEGLPGFSLRNNVPGNLGGLSAREQVVIESLVRQDTLIVQFSNTLASGSKRIIDYRITQLDGTPVPGWLNQASKDLLIGRREASVEKVDLRVEAVYSDQSTVVEYVRIDAATGEIQPLKMAENAAPAPRMFGDQFHAPSQLTPDEIQGLGRVIGK